MKLYDVIRKEKLQEEDPAINDTVRMLEQASEEHEVLRYQRPHHHFSLKKLLIIIGILSIVGILYVIGLRSVHARVTITERQIPFTLDRASLELVHEKEAE